MHKSGTRHGTWRRCAKISPNALLAKIYLGLGPHGTFGMTIGVTGPGMIFASLMPGSTTGNTMGAADPDSTRPSLTLGGSTGKVTGAIGSAAGSIPFSFRTSLAISRQVSHSM
jgi:hypothetical protein